MRVIVASLLMAAILAMSAGPASAEWIQHPMTGAYWWCDWYQDGGPYDGWTYWCEAPDMQTGEWSWFMAKPGWQYGPLGG